jgi:glycosyltransferase involved in cell wall biosynthesis/GT2 family glycosyltransferase
MRKPEEEGAPAKPTLSIVVLSWDKPEFTRACIDSIRAHTSLPYELIVVDNGSAGSTRRLVRQLADIAVLNPRNLGFSGGMNKGLSVASGEFVAFINNDVVLPPHWDELLVQNMTADTDVGMVVPAVTAAGNLLTVRTSPGNEPRVLRQFDEIPSAVVAVLRTAVMRDLGGWNERYFPASAEDADLAFTLWVNGFSVVFEERVLVSHVSKGTTREKFPNWRQLWHDNGLRFLDRWASLDPDVPRLETRSPASWEAGRQQASRAAQSRLREITVHDRLYRRTFRNHLAPRLERFRARRIREKPARPGSLVYISLHSRAAGQGAETHVRELTGALARRGWRVDVFRPRESVANARLGRRLLEMFAVQASAFPKIRRADCIYVRHHPMSLLVSFWSLLLGRCRIEEVNGTLEDWYAVHPVTRWAAVPFSWVSRLSLRTATVVVTVTPDLARWAESNGSSHVIVIPNGVDYRSFDPSMMSPSDSQPYVAFVGALTSWSGIDVALAAVESVSWPDGVQLVIAGDGMLKKRVEQVATEMPAVTFLGAVHHDKVPQILGGAFACLSPNTRRKVAGSPLKLYESMAAGRPVIATDVSGQREIVSAADCGILVPPGDPEGLAVAAGRLYADAGLRQRLGSRGREAAVAQHSWDSRAELLEKVLLRMRCSA